MEKFYIQAKVEKIDKNIEKAIKQARIQYPHPSLSFFLAKYALVDGKTPNLNHVILEKSVQEDVPLLIGTQVNKNHTGFLRLGHILSAFMVGDEIQIVICFDRTYNQKDYDEAIKLLDKGKLHVSFELIVQKADVEQDGKNKRIKHASFCGCGLLFDVNPAYVEGDVIQKAMEIITETLSKSEDKQLIYANVESISKKWLALGEQIEKIINEKAINDKQNINKEEIIVDEKAKKALLDNFKAELIAEKGDDVKDWTDEQFAVELEKRANEDENEESKEKKASEQKPEDQIEAKQYDCECLKCGKVVQTAQHCKDIKCPTCGGEMRRKDRPGTGNPASAQSTEEVKAEDKPSEEAKKDEDQVINEKTTETRVYDVKRDTESNSMEVVETITIQKEVDGKVVKDEKIVRETVYSQAKIDAMKVDYEAKLAEKDTVISAKDEEIKQRDENLAAKDAEITFIKENAKKIIEIRAELGDFVKDISDEELVKNSDKVEIARLKKTSADKDAEIERLKATKASEKPEAATVKKEILNAKDENATVDEETEEEILEAHLKEKNKKANKR